MLRSYQKSFLILVTSLFISLPGYSLTCKPVEDTKEFYECDDGKVYRFFEKDEAKRLAKDLVKGKENEKLVSELEKKITEKDKQLLEKDFLIEYLKGERASLQALVRIDKDKKFWEEPVITFFTGFALAAGSFAMWEYTRKPE